MPANEPLKEEAASGCLWGIAHRGGEAVGGTSSGMPGTGTPPGCLSCNISILTPGKELAPAIPCVFPRLLFFYPKNVFKKKIQQTRLRNSPGCKPLVLYESKQASGSQRVVPRAQQLLELDRNATSRTPPQICCVRNSGVAQQFVFPQFPPQPRDSNARSGLRPPEMEQSIMG